MAVRMNVNCKDKRYVWLIAVFCLCYFNGYYFSDIVSTGYLHLVRHTFQFDSKAYDNISSSLYPPDATENSTYACPEGYLVWNPQCSIPDVDPWHVSIRNLIKHVDPVVCSTTPPLTQVNGQTLTLLEHNLPRYPRGKKLTCCYQEITRRDGKNLNADVDNAYSLSDCFSFKGSVNLTSKQQFIMVNCYKGSKSNVRKGSSILKNTIYTDFHATVPILEEASRKIQNNTQENKKMSVLIIGIDSVSRLNLIRTMPKTVDFLKKTGWVEMKGYNKMDDNTFPNLMAILTGLNLTQVRNTCMTTIQTPLDDCPFIWKNLSEHGYITGYGEDDPLRGTFNHVKLGFFKTPTDYYLRPFMLAAEHIARAKLQFGLKVCLGPTLSTDHIYKYATDFAKTFLNHPSFGLFWMNTLSHNDVNSPTVLEKRTLKFLQDLSQNGVLNNTFVIFLSDHGIRFGDIRETYVGWLEERLPFIFLWIPEWYRHLYPQKYTNLLNNTGKLTSPFDLHLTIQDVLYGKSDNGSISCPRCVSMFDKVPWNRSCSDVGITDHWCTCYEYQNLRTDMSSAQLIVNFTLHEMNNLLDQGRNLTKKNTTCAKLKLNLVLAIKRKLDLRLQKNEQYLVTFETTPGNALFEASVSEQSGQYRLLGPVSRINMFGTQSECINDAILQKYCFCTNA